MPRNSAKCCQGLCVSFAAESTSLGPQCPHRSSLLAWAHTKTNASSLPAWAVWTQAGNVAARSSTRHNSQCEPSVKVLHGTACVFFVTGMGCSGALRFFCQVCHQRDTSSILVCFGNTPDCRRLLACAIRQSLAVTAPCQIADEFRNA